MITAGQGSNTIIIEWLSGNEGTINVAYNNCYLKCGGSDELKVFLKSKYKLLLDNDQICSGDLAVATAYNENNVPVIIEKWEIKDENGNLLSTETNKANIQYVVPNGISKLKITTTSQTYCDAIQSKEAYVLPKSLLPKGIKGEKAIGKGNDNLYEAESNMDEVKYTWKRIDGNITKHKVRSCSCTMDN
ncbi:MAG: hypothetical protein IPO92_18165 [Saprospiraceae bacterium]|nr:hypothetical protein [Saprospiraceae bacterium]